MLDRLYDISERAQVNFIGYISDTARYDFAIIYTDSFFGKPIVIDMQTNVSALLCEEDIRNLDYLQHVFNISTREEAEELSQFLSQRVPAVSVREQY